MGPVLQVEALQGQVKAVEDFVDEWASKSIDTSNRVRQEHVGALKQAKENMKQLKETEAKMSKKAEKLEQRLTQESAEMEQLTDSLGKVQEAEKALPPKIETIKENISSLQQAADVTKQGLELSLQEKQAVLANLQTIKVDFFRTRLGLRFDRSVPGVLRLVFTQIDRKNPSREYTIGVQVLEENEELYVVRECSPPVDGLDGLLRILNDNNDLRAFMLGVRGKFKQLTEADTAIEPAPTAA
mmetsp:Transcript_21049/g.35322  ORF Transcript_21049/g.35322 Transcript_21049/m.35322 type:complete len:242 (+) Transcript_21049:300-1025(+)